MDQSQHPEVKTYLRRLGWALSSLPEKDRDDIVEETRFHVLARIDQGQSPADALSSFGSAEDYAAGFIDEMEVANALATQRPAAMLGAVSRRLNKSLAAFLAFVIVVTLGGLALGCIVGAVMKPFDPGHVGLWASSRGSFFFGSTEHPENYYELLGLWIYPLAFVSPVIAWLLSRIVLRLALKAAVRV